MVIILESTGLVDSSVFELDVESAGIMADASFDMIMNVSA